MAWYVFDNLEVVSEGFETYEDAVKTLQENKHHLSFEQVRVIRDLLDECVLRSYHR